jgi:hypothetical protein
LALRRAGVARTVALLPLARNHGGSTAAGGRFHVIAGRRGWNEVSGDVSSVDPTDTTFVGC